MSAAAIKLPLDLGKDSTGAPLGQDPKNPKRDDKVKRMGTGSIPKLILEFGIPAIVGMLVNGAYNVIDSIFLGNAMGELGLSVATVAAPIMIIFLAIAMLVGAGGNALAALRLGEGKRVSAEKSLGNTVVLSIAFSIIVAICAATPAILDALLTLSSATDEVRPYAASFIRIICFGFVFQCIGMGVNNFIRTAGAPNRALVTMIVGAVACTIFNYLFVVVFGWGVEGSALATVMGQAIACILVLWYFIFTKNVPIKLHFRYMKPSARVMLAIVSLGAASFFIQGAAAVVTFVINHLLVVYGASSPIGAGDALASIGVVQRIAMFTLLPLIGIGIATQPLLGFNYGARLIGRVRSTLWYGVGGAIIIGFLMWIIVHFFADQIVSVFGISHPGLQEFTVFALKVQLFMLPLIGLQIVGSQYFQATGQPLKSVILILTRQILFLVPLLFLLPTILPQLMPQFNSLDALYFAAPFADVLSIFAVVGILIFEMRRLRRLERGEMEVKIYGEDAS